MPIHSSSSVVAGVVSATRLAVGGAAGWGAGRRLAATVVALLSGVVAVAEGQAPASAAGSVSRSGAPERYTLVGREVAIYNVAGQVRLVAGTGREVVVDVTRRGRDAGAMHVAQGPIRGREALRVWMPAGRVVYPALGRWTRTTVRVRDDGTFGDGDGAWRGRGVEIRASGDGAEAWAELAVAVPVGQRVVVHLAAGEATAINVDGDLVLDVQAAAVRTERTRGRLQVDAGSGRLAVRDAEGEVTLDSGSGRVELDDVRAGRLRLDVGSGAVVGRRISAASLELDAGSGSVRLAEVRSRTLRVDTGSGDVDLGFADDVDDVRIDAGSGAVTLRVPPVLGAEVAVETGSGGIQVRVPMVIAEQRRDRLSGQIGDGRGRIAIDGGSGEIRLVPASDR